MVLIYGGVWVLVGSVIYLIVQALVPNQGEVELLASILSDLALVAVLVAWLRARHPEWIRAIGWPAKGQRLREGLTGAASGVVLYPIINIFIGTFFVLLTRAIVGHQPVEPRQLPAHLTTLGVGLAVVFAVLVAPVTEEFLFRGCLFRSLRDRYGFWIGALGSAALFGLVHIPLNGGLFTQQTMLLEAIMMCTGFGFALVYEWRGNLMASIAAHMAFNALGIVLILGMH